MPRGPTTDRIISQLVGAGTSVGENYVEADDSVWKKEFLKCIGTCKKEACETKHFLRMAVRAVPGLKSEARKLWIGSQGIAPDLFKGLENRQKQMTKHKTRKRSACTIILASSFEFPSSFVIRHWSSATRYSSLFL
ncbi:MAG: hypothetical protein DME60_01280 [Verrucomicrobia bacterium]|nr:MAG: hypothetical protein DME60_01280 [Verrucomicrobiota bacterium]